MKIQELQAFWFLVISLLIVVLAVYYIALTGHVLRKKSDGDEGVREENLFAHKVVTSFFFPLSLLVALYAVTRLIAASGGRFSPFLLYLVHMFFVFVFGYFYLTTWHNDGRKNAPEHHKLARVTGKWFLIVTVVGCFVGSYNPIIRGAISHYF